MPSQPIGGGSGRRGPGAGLGQSMVSRRPLRMEIDEIQTQILQLSEEQYTLLKVLGNRREAAVSGCAGSGKTFLATRLARRLYRQGYRVLLTCFNRPLSDWLEETTYDELRHEEGGSVELQRLVVKNYHQLCQMLAGRHGVPKPRDTTGPRDPAWVETLHREAGEALVGTGLGPVRLEARRLRLAPICF